MQVLPPLGTHLILARPRTSIRHQHNIPLLFAFLLLRLRLRLLFACLSPCFACLLLTIPLAHLGARCRRAGAIMLGYVLTCLCARPMLTGAPMAWPMHTKALHIQLTHLSRNPGGPSHQCTEGAGAHGTWPLSMVQCTRAAVHPQALRAPATLARTLGQRCQPFPLRVHSECEPHPRAPVLTDPFLFAATQRQSSSLLDARSAADWGNPCAHRHQRVSEPLVPPAWCPRGMRVHCF
jgi:hypothetical protein